MSIFQKLQEDLRTSMKAGEKQKVDILRFVIAEIKKEVVDSGLDRENISDETTLQVLEKSAKSRKESIKAFISSNRPDLAESEQIELDLIKTYLPAEISDEELKAIVDKVKAENPTLQGGVLMGKLMPLLKGKADPDRIKALL